LNENKKTHQMRPLFLTELAGFEPTKCTVLSHQHRSGNGSFQQDHVFCVDFPQN